MGIFGSGFKSLKAMVLLGLALFCQTAFGQVLAPPGNISGTGRCAVVDLTWDAVTGASGYGVYRSTDPNGTFSKIVTLRSHSFRDGTSAGLPGLPLDYSTQYWYKITTVNSAGEGAQSSAVSATTTAPTNWLTAVPSGMSNMIRWGATTTGPGLLYRVAYNSHAQVLATFTSTPAFYLDRAAAQGIPNFYRLYTNANGWETGPLGPAQGSQPDTLSSPFDIVPNPTNGILPDPMAFPDWMGNPAPTDASGGPSGGPASAINIELGHGVADIDSGPDLIVANPRGPDIAFQREYRTSLAAGNLSAPGLSPGWTHNWNYRIVDTSTGTWPGTLKLVYPNGSCDALVPQVVNGSPTGQFTVPAGAPYIATGVADTNHGVWQSITLSGNGLESRTFTNLNQGNVLNLSKVGIANGSQLNFTYASGKLTQIDNAPNGGSANAQLNLTYTGNTLTGVSDAGPTGNYRVFNYSSNNLSSVSRINNSSIAEWSYQYSNSNATLNEPYLTTVGTTDPANNSVSAVISYSPDSGRATLVTDSKSNMRGMSYLSTGGAQVTISTSSGTLDQFTKVCDGTGKQTGFTDMAGGTTQFTYGAADPSLVITVQPPLGAATTWTNPDTQRGNMTRLTYPHGNYATYTWEYPTEAPIGRIKQIQETGGAITKQPTVYAYYGANDPNGPLGFLKTITYPNHGTITYTYTAAGNVKTISGIETASFDYIHTDNQGGTGPELFDRPYKTTDGNGNVTYLSYDPAGQLYSVTDPLGNVTRVQYNEYNQPTNISLPASKSLALAYNVNGKAPYKATLSSSSGNTTLAQTNFDSESAVSSSVNANGLTTSQSLNSNFDLGSVTNANFKVMHQFTPNYSQRKVTSQIGTGAKAVTTNTSFNSVWNPTSSATSMSSVSVFYDSTDPDLVTSTNSIYNGQSRTNSYATSNDIFDSFGRVTQSTAQGDDSYIQHNYTYDDEDHILSDTVSGNGGTFAGGSAAVDSVVEYAYNVDGTVATMKVHTSTGPQGVKYVYSYDGNHQTTLIQAYYIDSGGNQGNLLAKAEYTYDALGRVTIVRTAKAVTLYSYDSAGNVSQLFNLTPDGHPDPNAPQQYQVADPDTVNHPGPHTVLSSFTAMTYDDKGNRNSMSIAIESQQGSGNNPSTYLVGGANWTYDSGSRLQTESWSGNFGSTVNYTHGLDNADNLTTLRSSTFNVDVFSDQMTNSSNPYNSVSFDGDGNRASWNGISAPDGFDALGQLTYLFESSLGASASLNQEYGYDDSGRRLFHVANGSGFNESDTFVYSGTELIKRSGAGYWFTDGLLYGSDLPGQASDIYYIVGPTGPVVEFDLDSNGNSTNKTLTYDPQGSCVASTDGAADHTSQWLLYDAYGRPVWTNNLSNDGTYAARKALNQPFQYKGQFGYYTDGHNGLCYCIHRFYDAGSGRWISRDPAGLDGGINTYSYCAGNPVMRVDPSGLDWKFTIFGFEFSGEVLSNGSATGVASLAHTFTLGKYRNAWAESQPGYAGSQFFANVSFEALSWAAGEGAISLGSKLITGTKIARAVEFARAARAVKKAENVAAYAAEVVRANTRKMAYLFGRATGNAHNIERSVAMAQQLAKIGIHDSFESRQYVYKEIMNAYKNSPIIGYTDKGCAIRELLIKGPHGLVKAATFWDGEFLRTVMLYGAGG